MRPWIARILLCSFLFATTELHQVLRLPALLFHFVEHKSQSPGLSFVDFVKEHYSSPALRYPGEEQQHEQLPFKDNHCLQVHFAVVALPTLQPLVLPRPEVGTFVTSHNFIPPYHLVCKAYEGDVWNPPKA